MDLLELKTIYLIYASFQWNEPLLILFANELKIETENFYNIIIDCMVMSIRIYATDDFACVIIVHTNSLN